MPAILQPLQLTSSRQPVLDTGEVMLLIVEKVDLCFEDTGGLVEALAPAYKNGLCFLTNERLAWVEAKPPAGMQDRSCCVALNCLATAVSSSGTSLVSYPKVRLSLGVDAYGCACLHKERVREEKLKLVCRGRSGSSELKAAIQEQLAAAASAASAKPPASGQEARPGPATAPPPQPPGRTQPVAGPPPPEAEEPVWPPWAAATPHAASMAVDPAFYGPTTTVSNPLHAPPGASAYLPPAGAAGQFYGQQPGAAYPPAPSQYRPPPPPPPQQQQQLDMPAFTGVSGVMRRQEQAAKKVESDMSQAFQDLTGLINKAGDMVNLAKRLRQELRKPKTAASGGGEGGAEAELLDMQMELQLIDMGIASPVTREVAGKAYHRELAKQLADFLASPLEKAGGMMALPDIFCRFNRARGTELVSPDDLLTAIKLFQKVGLQLKLRKFDSGVLVVQSANHSDAAVCQRMKQLVLADQGPCVKGITASDVTTQFNVPLTIAREQLLLAEQLGALCRDDGPEGLRFFNNFFLQQAA